MEYEKNKQHKRINELTTAIKEAIAILKKKEEANMTISRASEHAIIELYIIKEDSGYGVYLFNQKMMMMDKMGQVTFIQERWKELHSYMDTGIYEELNLPSQKEISEYIQEKENRKSIGADEEKKLEEKNVKKAETKKEEIEILKTDQEIGLDREITNHENTRMWIKRTTGVDAKRLWRKKNSSHDYEYIAELPNGKKAKVPLSTKAEGKNSRQQIWSMTKEKTFVKKDVDSLILNESGTYGIATDEPENVLEDNTKTMLVIRLPGGEYISIEGIQKDTRDTETSNNTYAKDITSSSMSIYDMNRIAKLANISKGNDTIMQDGTINNEELKLVDFLKREGFNERQIDKIIENIYDGLVEKKLKCGEAEERVEKIKSMKEKGYTISEIEEMLDGRTLWSGKTH